MVGPDDILKQALSLNPTQKAELIDKLLSSLDNPDKSVEDLWKKESENRIDAFKQGKINTVTLGEVLERYK